MKHINKRSSTQCILARAFGGELGTNDPADESAEESLKRVLSGGDPHDT